MQMMNKKIKTTKSIRQVRAVHLNIYIKIKCPAKSSLSDHFFVEEVPPKIRQRMGIIL